MRNNILFFSFLFVTVFFLVPDTTLAHKVRVFAYGEGDAIVGETAFSGGRKPKNADIFVEDAASGKQLFSGKTDDQGEFRFDIPQEARAGKMDLLIIVKAGDGHRGEWPLEAADYLEDIQETQETAMTSTADSDSAGVSAAEEKTGAAPARTATDSADTRTTASLQQIQQVMEKTLDKKLAPVKHMLAQAEDQEPTLQDILGGIGYILGLAGIAAYFKAGQRNKGSREC